MSQSPKHEPASDTRSAMSEAEVAECNAICRRMIVTIECVVAAVRMHAQIEKEDPSEGAPSPFLSRTEIFLSLGGLVHDIASDRDNLVKLFGAK